MAMADSELSRVVRRLGGAIRSEIRVAGVAPFAESSSEKLTRPRVFRSDRPLGEVIAASEEFERGTALQLDGQVDAADLDGLKQAACRLGLAYVADPCADLALTLRAFAGSSVPLALSAHRYPRPDLATAMISAGFQILLIDSHAIGGPHRVRALGILAELCGIEVGIYAIGQSEEDVVLAGAIAATVESCTQPVLVPAETAARIGPSIDTARRGAPKERDVIRQIRLRRVSVPMRQLYVSAMYMRRTTERIIIEVETEDGQRGYGETNGTPEVSATCAEMAHKLLGQCPLDHLRLRRACAGTMIASHNGLRDWAAWAGLEMALLDWRGRALEVPLHRLLGDAGPESHEAVCHIPALLLDHPVDRKELPKLFADAGKRRQVVEHTLHQHREAGFTAFKIKSTGTSPEWDLALLRDLRTALGPDVRLRWDPNAHYPPAQALALAQRLEELKLEFYEDPTRGIAGMAQVRAHVATPLATNMCVINFDHLTHAIHQPCVDVLLADVVMWGGPQSIVDLASVTPLLGLDLTIHSAFEVGIGTAMNLHLARALAPVQRAVDFGLENMEAPLITPDISARGGRVRAPDGPGLGIQPDWEQVRRYQTDELTIAA
jgi:glucarate dehydratase